MMRKRAFRGKAPAAYPPRLGELSMLKLKPNCECCDKHLAAHAADAVICSFECTFCADCAANRLPGGRCPNCGGELVRRPVRPPAMLAKYPASTERVRKPHAGCGKAA